MRMKNNTHRLTAHFGLMLLLSFAAAVLVFCFFRIGGGLLLEERLMTSDYQQRANERIIGSFRSFVDENALAATDADAITVWVRKHRPILLEIYRANVLRYTSAAPEELTDNEEEVPYYAWVSYHEIPFADGTAEVVIYADDASRFFSLLTAASLCAALLVFLLVFLRDVHGLVKYICLLSEEIQTMEGGDLNVPITFRGNNELTRLACGLDAMRRAFQSQREAESNIFRANQAMITAMSHDLRTPLTTLQIYTDILRYKKHAPDQLDSCLEVIDAKAAQIKQLTEHIFEYSLVSRFQPAELEPPCPPEQVFHDQLSGLAAYLGPKGFSFDLRLDWPDCPISVNTQYVKRLTDNISSNLEKYAAADAPILIEVTEEDGGASISFQNVVSPAPPSQEGTRIGLVNMKTMMEKMGGKCLHSSEGSVFRLELWFPDARQSARRNGPAASSDRQRIREDASGKHKRRMC